MNPVILLDFLHALLWGWPMIIVLMTTHIYYSILLRFPQRHIATAIRASLSSMDVSEDKRQLRNPRGFSSLMTTLAATVGTGNIIGMSAAVALGGPGAVFWCWLTGLFGMATSYAECYLAVHFREQAKDGTYIGGPMQLLGKILRYPRLAGFYAVLTILSAFGTGCMTQSNAVALSLQETFHLEPQLCGILLAVLCGLVILGGIQSIATFCSKFMPFLCIFFLLATLFLFFINLHYLDDAIILIMQDAFSLRSIGGGVTGSCLLLSMRHGISRGLFTNEAGMGTSAITASASESNSPKQQALISMSAVFWDTVVLCLTTGLVIVSSMCHFPDKFINQPISMYTHRAFEALPFVGSELLSLALSGFGVTTMISWSFYGERATEYLFGVRRIPIYKTIYLVMIFLGCILPIQSVMYATDIINALMILPNLMALILLKKYIIR